MLNTFKADRLHSSGSARQWVLALLFAMVATPAHAVESIFVQSTLDYNAILISEIDIVFVYTQDAVDSFPTSKSEWFGNKREYLEQHANSAEVVSVFIPQGFDSEMVSLPERSDEALAVFVYGQHDSSNRRPVDVSDMAAVLVQIDEFGIVVTSR